MIEYKSQIHIPHEKYKEYFRSGAITNIKAMVEKYTRSTFKTVRELKQHYEFAKRLDHTNYFLYHAKTGYKINLADDYVNFLESWVFQNGHCYITDYGTETFKIAINLPGAEKIINNNIRELILELQHHDDTTVIPQILGYQLQSDFYTCCSQVKQL